MTNLRSGGAMLRPSTTKSSDMTAKKCTVAGQPGLLGGTCDHPGSVVAGITGTTGVGLGPATRLSMLPFMVG